MTAEDAPAIRAAGRRLWRWRAAAVALFALALGLAVRHGREEGVMPVRGPHIARLVVNGVIGNDVARTVTALRKAAVSPEVTGLLVVVNSPGGGVTGGERLHDAIERFAARKPVAVSMGDMGASAAYMLSVPAQRIFVLPSTLTGSIGVLFERVDASPLMAKLGVGVTAVVSGPMKDQTDPTSALTPEGRAMLQGLVNDLFDQFVAMVVKGRRLPDDRVRALADGRPYTGRQAVALGLVDEIGDEEAARSWLRHRLGVTDVHYAVAPLLPDGKRHWYQFVRRRAALDFLLGPEAVERLEEKLPFTGLDGPVAILQR